MAEAEAIRILVADNDPASLDILIHALGEHGRTVETARSGSEALDRLAAAFYDLVVTDIDLAEGAPRQFLHRIRMLRPYSRVIVTAAEGTPSKVVCALREHAFVFLGKPLVPRVVAHMAEQAISTTSWEDDIEVLAGSPAWIAMWVRCKLQAADRLVHCMREADADLTASERDDIAAAIWELLLNAIEHGAGSDPRKRIRVGRVRTSRAVVYHVQDPGPGFSFDGLSHAAVANPPGEPVHHTEIRAEYGVRPGGFGILLTRNLADELIYNEAGNEVLFIKYLKGGTGPKAER